MSDVTHVFNAIESGQPQAADQLLPLVYEELRKLAAARLSHENSAQTLQPTALVHEAWLRMTADNNPSWQNRAHFFAAAAESMRRILIERARRRAAVRHGGGQQRVNIDEIELAISTPDDDLMKMNEAVEKFAAIDKQKSDLVKLRYFVGMTIDEAAEALGISVPTAKRWWTYARAWLYSEMQSSQ